MAKLTYGTTISAIYDPQVGAPLDSRMTVASFNDLIDIKTWKTDGGTSEQAYSYYGMLVYVGQDKNKDKNGLYTLQPSNIEGRTVKTDTEDPNCWVRISQPDARINEIENKLIPVNYDSYSNEWKNYVINDEKLKLQSGLTIDTGQIYTNTRTFSVNTILGGNNNAIFSVSNDGTISGSSVLWAKESTTDITDTHIVTKGYLNKRLEGFTPNQVQSQLQMFVHNIDENDNITETTDVANIQIVRETNGTLTFEVEDTSTPEAEVLAGNSNTTINTTLQLNINEKQSDGTIKPTSAIANVMVVRNVSGKMSIIISE